MNYVPEGLLAGKEINQHYLSSIEGMTEAMEKGVILESRAVMCSSSHDLIVELPCAKGIIPREEGAIGIDTGKTRDIAIISRVNKNVCFKIINIILETDGSVTAVLSRRPAQAECMKNYVTKLCPGDVIEARVPHLEQFGSFVDIGCGIPSLIPIDAISVSRISHPSDRFINGQYLKAVVKSNDNGRICLTHKELLGTWEENAEKFSAGETVAGIVRSVEDYGVFVELTPNLAGLAEPKENIKAGQCVSVYIKAILPDKMKIKLVIVDVCEDIPLKTGHDYFISDDHISSWKYSPDASSRCITTEFE